MNKVIFTGNLGKDAILKFVPNSGKAILEFSVGVARGFKREDGTDWFNCALFGERAEKISPFLMKGTKVLIEGALRINSYEKDGVKKYSTQILVNNLEFLSKKEAASGPGYKEVSEDDDDSGEIPF